MQDNVSWRKPLAGTVFSIVCTLGILAGIFPSKCSGTFHSRATKQRELAKKSVELPEKALNFSGHHPICGKFGAHVFQAGQKILCAGCIGLILGATFSLGGVTVYFFLQMSLASDCLLVFWPGLVGVACGLLQYHLFNWGGSLVHLSVNTFFVLGTFLLLVGVDAVTQSIIVDLYVIALSLFWLYTRILLSQLYHRRICTACGIEECGYREREKQKALVSASHSVKGAYDD
jgi:hypothetical protein